jgi:N-acetylmuramoyl-L-alanine amidase
MKIGIDAGHGGDDPGATSSGYQEKDLTLEIASMMDCFFRRYDDIEVISTRLRDKTLSLEDRVNKVNDAECDVFISCHINAAEAQEARGFEVFHFPSSQEGKRLANTVDRQVDPILKDKSIPNRGVKDSRFYVLRNTAMPAILIEFGFITNESDRQYLTDSSIQFRFVDAIYNAVREWNG